MSVSLTINWPNGEFEDVPFAGMLTAKRLAKEAQQLG